MSNAAAPQAMTLDELYRLPDDEQRYELVNGWLVSEPPPGARHGRIATRIATLLDTWARRHRTGVVLSCDTGFVLHETPDTVRAPDVAFVTLERYQALADERRAIPGAPDLAVEVLSPGNTRAEIHARVADYLAAGSTLVWVIDADLESVFSYCSLFQPQPHSGSDELAAADLLPGFSIAVSDIFSI
ncbi:MAG: Uma2 family endonuclease [Gammaproteobacteria bacterium]|nr:Uma2 family endonuclease [Gammaproteobacteria bacterium]